MPFQIDQYENKHCHGKMELEHLRIAQVMKKKNGLLSFILSSHVQTQICAQ